MDFEVIIIGSDANAYYMARCYHEEYNRKARVISFEPMSFVNHSKITIPTYDDRLWDSDTFAFALNEYVKDIEAKKIVCISSNETYARNLVLNKEKLDPRIVYNYVDLEFLDSLMMKDLFFETYKDSGLLPKTIIHDPLRELNIDFDFPIIIKPCDVIDWNHINFIGKKKIYKLDNMDEVNTTIENIKNSEYQGKLIIQEYIPGDDSALFDSVVYCNKDGEMQLMAFAQIGLQEHTTKMVGNAAVLINGFDTNGYDETVIYQLKEFMESINFKGLAELDIKYDYRDKKYKILEINARQGRCSYYVSFAGYNLVKYVVDDLIYNKEKEFVLVKEEVLLTYIPKKIMKKYVVNGEFKKKALELYKRKKVVNPLIYKKDLPLKRILFLVRKHFRYFKDYKNGYWKY